MAVRPESLETPERGLVLEDRGPAVVPARVQAGPEDLEDTGLSELEELRDRIEKARRIEPGPQALHCRDCFTRGRDAALKVIEG
jgi:hypothetical protein